MIVKAKPIKADKPSGLMRSDEHRSGNRIAISALLITVTLFLGFGVTAGAAEGSSFCGERIARDYAAPFSRMPKLHRLPVSGRLPFAPPHTVFNRPDSQVLVPGNSGGSEYGYGFKAEPGADRTFDLNWDVEVRLVKVDRTGSPRKVVDVKERRIGEVSEVAFNRITFRFDIDARPSFYRVDSVFRRTNGALLARYGEYIRVVRPRLSPGMLISSRSVGVGNTVLFRVTNLGTEQLLFSDEYAVQRFIGGVWTAFPASIGPWTRVLRSLSAGQVGRCQSFTIPHDMPPGRYRIRKKLNGGRASVAAEFDVQA